MLARFSRTYVNVQARSLTLRGVLDAQRGRTAAAEKHLLRAASRAQELDTPFERARALCELARISGESGHAAREEARALFNASGAPGYASLLAPS